MNEYGVVVKYEGSGTGTSLHMVECDSIATASSMVTNWLNNLGLIPVSLSIHEFGQPICYNKTSNYWPNLDLYRRLKDG